MESEGVAETVPSAEGTARREGWVIMTEVDMYG